MSDAPARQVPAVVRDAWTLAVWSWRQLTSMRVALLLLLLLAVAAIPGSVVPQRQVNPLAAAEWAERSPTAAAWAERLGLFDVYAAPWFVAVYLLLVVSLIGCIVPRMRQHWRALRADPPPPPRHLERLPAMARRETTEPPVAVLEQAGRVLRERGFRVVPHHGALAAERGYRKETGNLAFHAAIVVVLLGVALGGLGGYRASVLVVEGGGFANTPIQYDGWTHGPLFAESELPPFAFSLDEFEMRFVESGPGQGNPEAFVARGRLQRTPGAAEEAVQIAVNQPLSVAGTQVHLLNPGYAPRITVRDAAGEVVFADPVPFLPQDASFTSTGVVKVPLAQQRSLVGDLGIEGLFLPTGVVDPEQGPVSVFPGLGNPVLVVTAWSGDLGLDDGVPQSVYRLDKTALTQFEQAPGDPFRAALQPGDTVELPDGAGSITFDGVSTWVNLQVGRNAGMGWVLGGAVLAILGLLPTLTVRRQRCWVRCTAAVDEPGQAHAEESQRRTVVLVGGLESSDGGGPDLHADIGTIADAIVPTSTTAPSRQEAMT